MKRLIPVLALAGLGIASMATATTEQSPEPTTRTPTAAREAGVTWLTGIQNEDGGWGSGAWGADNAGTSDVATTAYVTLALMRDAGSTDENSAAIQRGITFVADAVLAEPEGSRVRTLTGTQPQYKLGENVDTHLAAMTLGKVQDRFQGALGDKVTSAYQLAVQKVQRSQNSDGSFESGGWAPVLSSSLAAQSLYEAQMAGQDVDLTVLSRADAYQGRVGGEGSGAFDTSGGAGVQLYAVASSTRANAQVRRRATTDASVSEESLAVATATAESGIARVASDAALVTGFGSIGGEEMLSYQMISDTLSEEGGTDWVSWNNRIGVYLASIQNQDGSWSGHHCITSPVFVTAGAVMTLGAGNS